MLLKQALHVTMSVTLCPPFPQTVAKAFHPTPVFATTT